MTALSRSDILLIVGGGVAAYKSMDLIRRLRSEGAHVRVVLTAAAQKFVTALLAESLSGQETHTDLFLLGAESEMGHIALSRSADLVAIAPATADLLAKMTHGHADDLASTLLLATDKKVLAAPAMNVRMWLHPATRANVELLRSRGVLFIGPDEGEMACGEFGPGRMAEPPAIVEAIAAALAAGTRLPDLPSAAARAIDPTPAPSSRLLVGRRVVVTSGPTFEAIDPVRYIANRSSGRQGHAIAAAAAAAGAAVTLVSGPVALADPAGVEVRRVETASQMLEAVRAALPADIFVAAAAVADWRVARVGASKLKKNKAGPPVLELEETRDILAHVAALGAERPRLVVGFAAETNDLLANARDKLARKGSDLVIANDVGPGSDVMGGDSNAVHLVGRDGVESWPRLDKDEVARRLVRRFAELLAAGGGS
jgi:phosphopantothenoylcysteine decarboxylase/phosphopantothenate--cysteine ligase